MGSVRRRGDLVRVILDRPEASLVVSLVGQVSALLAEGAAPVDADPIEVLEASIAEDIAPVDSPILERLLPDAYRDDPEAAAEFRRLTHADLRATKRAALQQVLDDIANAGSLGRARNITVELAESAATAWLHALADVRLALGIRLNVTEDTEVASTDLPPESSRAAELAVYDWLTWLQDAVVRAMPI
jgi:hypothetical protein